MVRATRALIQVLLLAGTVSCASSPPTPPAKPDHPDAPPATLAGTVKLSGGLVAVGVGYRWGHGTLSYQDKSLDFCIRGLSIGDVGAASLDARGNVYNLQSPEDFSGKYFAISGGFTVARGGSLTLLKNERGVMLELESLETGLRFVLAASGVRIVMAGGHGCKGAAR
jgi:hypothetical protein